jgi:hypothetical protein
MLEGSTRYRWMVASRACAAAIGGYVLTSLATAALSLLLPRLLSIPRAEAVLTATLFSFVLYTGIVIWVFTTRSAARAWLVIGSVSLVLALSIWLLRP